jgi:hypothetical protein
VRLNVGCGRFRANGWINIDNDPTIIADQVADLTNLPPQIRGVTGVYLGHILHLLPPEQVPTVLHQLWDRCVSGAQVAAVGPDALRLLDQNLDLDKTAAHLGGDGRRWACTQQRLVDLLRVSGLQRVRPVLIDSEDLQGFPVVSQVSWQCAARGQVR